MGLLNGIPLNLGVFGNLLGGGNKNKTAGFRDELKRADFFTADVAVVASTWTDIGSYTTGAQQSVNIGYGNATQDADAGYLYVTLNDANGSIGGKFRIVITDANDVGKFVAFTSDLVRLGGSTTLKTQMMMLPENLNATAFQDDKVKLQVYADASSSIDYDNAGTLIYLPITRRYLSKK